jgi:hypothetical protein
MTRYVAAAALSLVVALGCAETSASAQVVAEPAVRWVEIDVGGGLVSAARLGTVDASLRANDRTEQPYRLFAADHRFARTRAFHVRAARPLGRRWGIEGGFTVSHPTLRAAVSGDVEGAPALTINETVDQYFIDGGVVFALEELRLGRVLPFATAGAGYLRQLHEGQAVIEHGQLFQAGAGVKYPLVSRASGVVRTAGLRVDLRAYVMRGGVSVENRPRPHVAISGSVFVGL